MYFSRVLIVISACLSCIFSEIYVKDDRTEEFKEGVFGKRGEKFPEYLRNFPEVKIVNISEQRGLACHEYSLNQTFGEGLGETLYERYKKVAHSSDSGTRMEKIIEDLFEETLTPTVGDLAVYYVHSKNDPSHPPVISHSGIFKGENRIESLWDGTYLLEALTFYYSIVDEVRFFKKRKKV